MPASITILNVDDDSEDMEIFCEAIRQISPLINCVVADGGARALMLLEATGLRPDIIFLDHNMPEMTGKQLLSELQKLDYLKNVPLVMHSTAFSEADKEYFRKRNAHYLLKQNTFQATVDKLADMIRRFSLL